MTPEYFGEIKERRDQGTGHQGEVRPQVAAIPDQRVEQEDRQVRQPVAANAVRRRPGAAEHPGQPCQGRGPRKAELSQRLKDRLAEIEQEKHLSEKPPEILGVAVILPSPREVVASVEGMESDPEVEAIAIEAAKKYEASQGRKPVSVEDENCGWDITSLCDGQVARYIEVKGRAGVGGVALTPNEWIKAQRFGKDYWLYVVVNCKTQAGIVLDPRPGIEAEPQGRGQRGAVHGGDRRLEASGGGSTMKALVWTVVGHILGIALLLALGLWLNSVIAKYGQAYAGVITVFTTAWGAYITAVGFLYNKNRRFHFWVNRLGMMFVRSHTYWQPVFDFELDPASSESRSSLLDRIAGAVLQGQFGTARRVQSAGPMLSISVDDLMCFVFRLDEAHLNVHLDRKLLVPAHLYDRYRHKLARIADEIRQVANPVSMRCGVLISFGDGVPNPYYGFFINRVPAELLQTFQVSFRLDPHSSCRIEAGTDCVNIEGNNPVDLFEGLSQVLALRALPRGVGQ